MRKRYLFHLEYAEMPSEVLFFLLMLILAVICDSISLVFVGFMGIFLIPYLTILFHSHQHSLARYEKRIMLSTLKSLRATVKGQGLTNRNKHLAVEKFERLKKNCPSSVLFDAQIQKLISQIEKCIDVMPMKPRVEYYKNHIS